MQGSPATDIARAFLDVVWCEPAPDDLALARALDRLLAASYDVPDSDGSDLDVDPPRTDDAALHAELAARFPTYGFYSIADTLTPDDGTAMVGDAIDDLADLTRDLREVIWRGENIGADDAAWCFRLLYFHWARHARELSLYLHARLFD